MTEHTPTPWRLMPVSGRIVDANRDTVCREPFSEDWGGKSNVDTANAEFIVRAVNAHDALLAAAKRADLFFGHYFTGRYEMTDGVLDQLRAAIALAEGQK